MMVPVGGLSSCLGVSELAAEFVADLGEGFVESAAQRRRDEAGLVGDGGFQRGALAARVTLLDGHEQVDRVGPV